MLASADAVVVSPRADRAAMTMIAALAVIAALVVIAAVPVGVAGAIATLLVMDVLGEGGRAAEQRQGYRPGKHFGHLRSP
jgi:hypothetical protein